MQVLISCVCLPCEVIVSYFRVIFFLAPGECCVPRVSWTFPLYWFSLKSIRELPTYLLEQCHSSFTFAITEDQRLDNLEGEVVRLSHSSRGIAISSEVLILHPCQWWKAVVACDSRGQGRGHSLLDLMNIYQFLGEQVQSCKRHIIPS